MNTQLIELMSRICEDAEIEKLSDEEMAYLEQVQPDGTGLDNVDITNPILAALAYDAALAMGKSEDEAQIICGDAELAGESEKNLIQKLRMTDGYVGAMGKTWETPTPEKFEQVVAGAMRENDMTREQVIEALTAGKALKWGESPNYSYDHSDAIIGTPKQRTPDYPEGRELDCGCTVYWAHEVMSASLGTACDSCYDRMSG